MEEISETLRTSRHDKKVSIADAARATKIKPEILERLEAGEFQRIAAPAYTKGFLKMYAEYLGLDSKQLVDAYIRSQGGLRRQGLTIETEASMRVRKPRELQLPVRRVAWAVIAVTVAVVVVAAGRALWKRSAVSATRPVLPVTALNLPKADFEAYYHPKTKPAPELLEVPAPGR